MLKVKKGTLINLQAPSFGYVTDTVTSTSLWVNIVCGFHIISFLDNIPRLNSFSS
jgi:hypothetical protein